MAAGLGRRPPARLARALLAVLALGLAGSAGAVSLVTDPPSTAPLPPELRGSRPDPALLSLWDEGLDLERTEQLLDSAQRYEAIARALPGSAFIHWRVARDYWRYAERLPIDDKDGRMRYFGLADHWAGRALELDPNCGECVLWKLAAMGRLATTGGVLKSISLAEPIARMIDRGIALHPTHRDGDLNVTLANLYYAGAAFYRIVPDWFWVQWVLGVRGDKQRALDYIQKALALSSQRIDYQVELGAVLLCMGHEQDDPARLAQGRAAMRRAMHTAHFQTTDQLDVEHAKIMLAHPERACGYSRDGWIDLSKVRSP